MLLVSAAAATRPAVALQPDMPFNITGGDACDEDDPAPGACNCSGTPMGKDQWQLLKQGSVVSGEHPGFAELGIEPKPLNLFLDKWMVRYRRQGRFSDRALP